MFGDLRAPWGHCASRTADTPGVDGQVCCARWVLLAAPCPCQAHVVQAFGVFASFGGAAGDTQEAISNPFILHRWPGRGWPLGAILSQRSQGELPSSVLRCSVAAPLSGLWRLSRAVWVSCVTESKQSRLFPGPEGLWRRGPSLVSG